MAAKIISFGIQKGGVGKTTTTAITAFLLSQKYRVLAVDFDSQGNLTQFLTQRNIYDFTGKTVLQAIEDQNPEPYIVPVTDRLHVLPSEDLLARFPFWLWREYKGNRHQFVLRDMLETVRDQYNFILIDLPPNLGDHTSNGLTASDYVVAMLQSDPFCYDALDRFLEFVGVVRERSNPGIELAGILTSMLDARASLDAAILERARGTYADAVFKTTIKRRSKLKEYTITGLQLQQKADRDALKNYIDFVEELETNVR